MTLPNYWQSLEGHDKKTAEDKEIHSLILGADDVDDMGLLVRWLTGMCLMIDGPSDDDHISNTHSDTPTVESILSQTSFQDYSQLEIMEVAAIFSRFLSPALLSTMHRLEKDISSNFERLATTSNLLCITQEKGGQTTPNLKRALISPASSSTALICVDDEFRRKKVRRETLDILTTWFIENHSHPYPTQEERQKLATQTGMSPHQVRDWFTNVRKRHWAPIKRGRAPRSFLEFILKAKFEEPREKATPVDL